MDYIKNYYNLPFLKSGMKLEMDGKKCTAVKEKNGHLQVKFENGSEGPIHPTWETVYLDESGNVIKDFRKKKKSEKVSSSDQGMQASNYFLDEASSDDYAIQAVKHDFDNASDRFSGFGSEDGGSFGGGGASGDWDSGSSDSSSSDSSDSYSE